MTHARADGRGLTHRAVTPNAPLVVREACPALDLPPHEFDLRDRVFRAGLVVLTARPRSQDAQVTSEALPQLHDRPLPHTFFAGQRGAASR
jgi:hypothetical protein